VPYLDPELYEMREALINDLTVISRIAGGYNFSSKCLTEWEHWYMRYDERSPARICKDPAFNGWYSRKPMLILKLAMINAAMEHSELELEWENISGGIISIEEAERAMSKTFVAVGRSEVSPEVNTVANIIEMEGSISESALLQRVWRDVDAKKFNNVIETVMRRGLAQRRFDGPNGEKEIWYYATKRNGY